MSRHSLQNICYLLILLSPFFQATSQYIDIKVNQFITGDQELPAIANLTDGTFIITWHGVGQDSVSRDVYGRIHHIDGRPKGSEFRVNNYTTGDQTNTSVAGIFGGGFVICWDGAGEGGEANDIYAKIYLENGMAQGKDFRVNTYITGDQTACHVSAMPNGGFIVVWSGAGADDDFGVFAQMFKANGDKKGSEFRVNDYKTGNQVNPFVSYLKDGRFIIAWQGAGPSSVLSDIFARIFDANGVAALPEFLVNIDSAGNQYNAMICPLANGGYIIGWDGPGMGATNSEVFAKIYAADGTPGTTFRANTAEPNTQANISIAELTNRDLVIVWFGYFNARTHEVIARKFNPDGSPKEADYLFPLVSAGYQLNPWVLPLSNENIAIVWYGAGADTIGDDILLQIYQPDWTRSFVLCNNLNPCNPALPICDSFRSSCRGCMNSLECSEKNYCEETSGLCKNCPSAFTKTTPTNIIKDCGGCISDQDCVNDQSTLFCNTNTHQCYKKVEPQQEPQQEPSYVTASAIASKAVVGAAAPLIAVNPSLLWSLMRVFQRFFYLQFCNVDYTENLKRFFATFSVGKLDFLPNVGNIDTLNKLDAPSPKHFYENEYNSLFLQTAGSIIFFWMALGLLYAILFISDKYLSQHLPFIAKKQLFQNFKTKFLPDAWDGTVSELLYGAYLQFFYFKLENAYTIISLIVAIASTFIVIAVGISRFVTLRKRPASIPPKQKWIGLIEYGCQMAQPFSMVAFYYYPTHQLGLLFVYNVICLNNYLDSPGHNRKKIFIELNLFIVHMLIAFVNYSGLSEGIKDALGFIIMAVCVIIVLVEIFVILKENYLMIKSLIAGRKRKDRIEQSKLKYGAKTRNRNLNPSQNNPINNDPEDYRISNWAARKMQEINLQMQMNPLTTETDLVNERMISSNNQTVNPYAPRINNNSTTMSKIKRRIRK